MDPGRALASLRALKSQPIPLARTAVEPRPVVAKRRSPHAARLRAEARQLGRALPAAAAGQARLASVAVAAARKLLLDASDTTAFAATAPAKIAEPAPPTGLAALGQARRRPPAERGGAAGDRGGAAPRRRPPPRRGGDARALDAFEQTDGAAPAAAAASPASGAEETRRRAAADRQSQLETYAFRTVLRAIGHVEPLRQRVLDAHSAKLRQVRERASE